MRSTFKPFEDYPLVDWDINRVTYRYKHFTVPAYMVEPNNVLEVWVDGKEVHDIQYVKENNFPGIVHCVLPFETDSDYCKVRYNRGVVFSYHKTTTTGSGRYVLELLHTDSRYLAMRDPVNSPYCISDNLYTKPVVTQFEDKIRYECAYTSSISFFIEQDLVWCGEVTENKAVYVDDPLSNYTYGAFMIDNDPDAEIDTRFYPCILPKKSGFLRLYDDKRIQCPYPEYTRVINYTENVKYFNEPYGSELDSRLPRSTKAVITSDMSDNEILEAFALISAYSYRWYEAPIIQDIAPVYSVLNNANPYAREVFKQMTYHPTTDTSTTAYVSTFPYDEYSDIIMYDGSVIYDYFVEQITFRNGEAWVDKLYGRKRYVITGDYDPDKLTVIKFNSAENVSIDNIEPWLDKNNLLQLHRKVNRFWHNFIALTSHSADIFAPEDQVWVGSETPPTLDDHLWFELMAYVDNLVTADNNEDIFPLVLGSTEPDVNEEMSHWKTDILHWIGEGSDISKEEVYNRILYVDGKVTDAYKEEGLILTSADGEVSFPDLVSKTALQRVYWEQPNIEDVEHNDIWMEWYATVKDHISYSSENTLVMHINENMYTIQFDEELEDLRIITFDNIVLNFRDWDRGVRYLSILADLQRSNLIDPEDMLIFYKRLITSKDVFNPDLHRCKTHISNVVSYIKSEVKDFSVVYGTNICHQHWDRDSGAEPLPDPVFPEIGSMATEDMPDVSHDTTYWYQFYPNGKNYALEKGNLLIGNGSEDAWPMQLYHRFLLVNGDPSDVYLNELILQVIHGSEIVQDEHYALYDRDKFWDNDQPYTFTQYLATSPRTITKIKNSPKYILQHLTALAQDEYYKKRREEEGVLLTSGVVSYFTRDDFTYIPDRCLVFVNGKYVPSSNIEMRNDYRFAILSFPELIETVDVYYCRTDIPQMRLMHSSNQYIPEEEWQKQSLGTASMEYINVSNINYQGYYDVLRKDYLDNNKLLGIIDISTDEEFEEFKKDLLSQFAAISEAGLFGSTVKDNRIIICGGGTDQRYQIFKNEGD